MRLAVTLALFSSRLAVAGVDPDEHGHGHVHVHPHEPDPHHHHKHAHPHDPGEGHHHTKPPPPEPPPPSPVEPKKEEPGPPPPPPPEILDFRPRRGPPGTTVTISGSGFSDKARVHYNGRPLKTRSKSDSILVVELPAKADSDVFVVRQKGQPDARGKSSFIVEPAPVISALSPAAAAPGEVVEIRGRNFLEKDQVLFGDRSAGILSLDPKRIEVLVPDGASDCRPRVVRPQAVGTSPRLFRVLAPQPEIGGLQPLTGAPGSTIRIVGRNFLPADRAMLGKKPLTVLARGPEFLDVEVPAGAESGTIRVYGPKREAKSESEFIVVHPPAVTTMEPTWAMPGARVALRGRHFANGDVVMVGDKVSGDPRISPTEITFIVPEDAESGPVSVVRGNARSATKRSLEVVRPPVLTGFEPAGGPGGTRVTLRGEHLTDAQVHFGDTKLRPLSHSATHIDVAIPRKASADRFTVATRAGNATSSGTFEIYQPAEVTSFDPAFGPHGTQVVIRGKNFTSEDTVSLMGQDLPLRSSSAEELTVVVPPGVGSGPFVVRSRGREYPTRKSFRVVAPPPPAVLTFTPVSGPPGTEVVLRIGRRFTGSDEIKLGGKALAKALRENGAAVVVKIPPSAETGRFEALIGDGERVAADQPFQVVKEKKKPSDKPGVY